MRENIWAGDGNYYAIPCGLSSSMRAGAYYLYSLFVVPFPLHWSVSKSSAIKTLFTEDANCKQYCVQICVLIDSTKIILQVDFQLAPPAAFVSTWLNMEIPVTLCFFYTMPAKNSSVRIPQIQYWNYNRLPTQCGRTIAKGANLLPLLVYTSNTMECWLFSGIPYM